MGGITLLFSETPILRPLGTGASRSLHKRRQQGRRDPRPGFPGLFLVHVVNHDGVTNSVDWFQFPQVGVPLIGTVQIVHAHDMPALERRVRMRSHLATDLVRDDVLFES